MFWISKALAAKIDISIPCISCDNATGDNPVGLIADFYELALALSGVLALGMIIYAGIKRVVGANKPSEVSESNDIIFNALLGIVLLFGAYILLNTVNPELTKLQIPTLDKTEVSEENGAASFSQKACGSPDPSKPGRCAIEGSECVLTRNDDTSTAGSYSCARTENVVWACEVHYRVERIIAGSALGEFTSLKNGECMESACDCGPLSKWSAGTSKAVSAKCVRIKRDSCTNLK